MSGFLAQVLEEAAQQDLPVLWVLRVPLVPKDFPATLPDPSDLLVQQDLLDQQAQRVQLLDLLEHPVLSQVRWDRPVRLEVLQALSVQQELRELLDPQAHQVLDLQELWGRQEH